MSHEDEIAKARRLATALPPSAYEAARQQLSFATEARRAAEAAGLTRHLEHFPPRQDILRLAAEAQRAHDHWLTALGPSAEAQHLFLESERRYRELMEQSAGPSGELRRMMEEIDKRHELTRLAFAPMEELRRAGIFADGLGESFARASQLAAEYEQRFRLPEVSEALRLFEAQQPYYRDGGLAGLFSRDPGLERALEAIRAPWLDTQDTLRSIAGFAELQGIGLALRTSPAFDERLTDALRMDLGDWRQPLDWPPNLATDPLVRAEFYRERGLNPSLTSFPAAAFSESVSIAGLSDPLPPAAGDDLLSADSENEEAVARNGEAYARLLHLERQMRQFIEAQMSRAVGENWIKHRVPGPMRDSWKQKKQKELDQGGPDHPLIAYADFTDYVIIITQTNNWNEIFKPFFLRQESIRESFQRLFPIRLCTMHARTITQDDAIYLYAETTRILKAIRKSGG